MAKKHKNAKVAKRYEALSQDHSLVWDDHSRKAFKQEAERKKRMQERSYYRGK